MSKKNTKIKIRLIKKIAFILLLVSVLAFYFWSNLFWVSLIMLLVVDSFTMRYVSKFIKAQLPSFLFRLFKYGYFLLLPVLIVVFVRTFLLDAYFVPSRSMESTLFPDDKVLVNKFQYGPKVPRQMKDLPLLRGFFKSEATKEENDPYRPLTGPGIPMRNDIVVFKAVNDNRKILVKRIIGLPGETLNIQQSIVGVDEVVLVELDEYTFDYVDTISGPGQFVSYSNVKFNGLAEQDKSRLVRDAPSLPDYLIFPSSRIGTWTIDNYGPITVPKIGMTIPITEKNYDLYRAILLKFERVNFVPRDGKQIVHTFMNNYYFMLGDNRHHSVDSRSFGFVPEKYILGKVVYSYSSK